MRPQAQKSLPVCADIFPLQDTLDAANNDAEHLVVERLRKKAGAPATLTG